ncbi:MAG: hypothetical protein AB8F74_09280 [Saprospiraceae bacterium]
MIFFKKRLEGYMVLAFSLLLLQSITACSTSKPVSLDSLPNVSKVYKGYRLVVSDISVKRRKSKSAQIKYNLINTGRESIFHKKGRTTEPAIFFEFDLSLKSADLESYRAEIIQQVLNNTFTLEAGRSLKGESAKIRLNPKTEKEKEDDGGFTISVGDSGPTAEDYIDQKFCPDLKIDTVIITRQTKRWVTIEYKIANHGKGPAAFRGKSGKEEDNLAIKAFLNRTGKLTKGAIPIGGSFIKDEKLLEPGDFYTGVIRLDISKKTRYSAMLILELDPYLAIRECDETNNKFAISLE